MSQIRALADGLLSQAGCVLTELLLGANALGPLGTSFLARFGLERAKSRSLTVLEAGRNEFGDEGALALASAIKANTLLHLHDLDLGGNGIGYSGVKALGEALAGPEKQMAQQSQAVVGNIYARVTDDGEELDVLQGLHRWLSALSVRLPSTSLQLYSSTSTVNKRGEEDGEDNR